VTASSSDQNLKRISKETTIKLNMNFGCIKYGGPCIDREIYKCIKKFESKTINWSKWNLIELSYIQFIHNLVRDDQKTIGL